MSASDLLASPGVQPRTVALLVAVLAALLAACGGGSTPAAVTSPTSTAAADGTTTTPPSGEPFDELVGADGARVRVRCSGTGSTTVVLVSGYGDAGDSWSAVTSGLQEESRVCSYSHLGTGTSDRPRTTQTFGLRAQHLRDLLRSAGEPGPYLLVGHSFGGHEVVNYAHAFPEDVVGLLLLDATPLGWLEAICAVADDGSEGARAALDLCEQVRAGPATSPEQLDIEAGFAETAAIDSLDAIPMIVAPALERDLALNPVETARLNHVLDAGQQDWASLSSSSQLIPVEDSGHAIQVDQPDFVIAQIRALLG